MCSSDLRGGAAATRIGQKKSGALPQQEMDSIISGALPQRKIGSIKSEGGAATRTGQYKKRGAAAARIGQYKMQGRGRNEKRAEGRSGGKESRSCGSP